MTSERGFKELSEFMQYLVRESGDGDRLPSLSTLSQQLGVSVATLREQLEVARALGLVEVKPKTGIRRLPYQFKPAVLKSLSYAASIDPANYLQYFADFRNHIEEAYWEQAVCLLTAEDHAHLRALVDQAFTKLNGVPIQIPHQEHRELHLSIYRRLNNPFVTGILEAYWNGYEAFGLDLYTDISYLRTVWSYHQQMVDAICKGELAAGYQALREDTDLLHRRTLDRQPAPVSNSATRQRFE
jgi:DNA-binding FadR family transcriptional regulator